MGKLRKIGKKIWRGVKKLGKKIGKAFKGAFKGIGKFLGKLGPIGTFALMIAMPYLGSYIWGGFSSWAGGLSGTFGKIMQGIVKVGDAAIGAYNTITDAIYGTIKKIPGVGDALEGFDRWLDRTRSAMGMEPGSISVMNEKELNTWAGTDAGAQAMGFENASAFKTANPNFFDADGKLTKTGLNFTRGKGVAYEAHLRGRDIFKKVDGEFDFNTYSDNFKNNVLDTDFVKGDISRFGESLQRKGKVTFRTGQPQGTQGSKLQEELAAHKKSLTPDELKAFDVNKEKAWITDYKAKNPLETVFHESRKGFFSTNTLDPTDRTFFDADGKPMYPYDIVDGDVWFEGVGSRYTHQVPVTDADKNIIGYKDVEGSEWGTAAWDATKSTVVSTAGGGAEERTDSSPYFVSSVADPVALEVGSPIDVTAGRGFPNTRIQLDYLDGAFTTSNYDWNQNINGGRYFPQILSLNYLSPQPQNL